MATNKKYWQSVEELSNKSFTDNLKQNEFIEKLPVDEFLGNKEQLKQTSTTRRDFLKFLGFSTAAASIAACEAPVRKAIPYVVKPEEITPGKANYYASTYYDGYDFASILVKTREGRPIKIVSNKDAPSFNCLNSRSQASILSLYDTDRENGATLKTEPVGWSEVDEIIPVQLTNINNTGKQIVLLTPTVISPSFLSIIKKYKETFNNFKHIQYDSISNDALLNAYELEHGVRAFPSYHFNKAEVVVSFGADFLGDWLYKDFDKDYAFLRDPDQNMSYHIQFESNLSLTGSNADKRVKIKASETGSLLLSLYNKIVKKIGDQSLSVFRESKTKHEEELERLATMLLANKKKSLVVSSSDNLEEQLIVLKINNLISAEGNTCSIAKPVLTKKSKRQDINKLLSDMNNGKVGALLCYNVNPAYSISNRDLFVSSLEKVDLKISFASKKDETSVLMDYNCPTNHVLESWADSNPKAGLYTFTQPTIAPLFDTRQTEESLLKWIGQDANYYDYLKSSWSSIDFNKAIHDGYYIDKNYNIKKEFPEYTKKGAVSLGDYIDRISSGQKTMELILYSKVGLGDGTHANNPWLQELPDPVSRVTWDNYLTISSVDANLLGLENKYVSNGALNGSKVNVSIDGVTLKSVPVLIQPGQTEGTVGLSFGYGRNIAGKVGNHIGVNAYAFYNGNLNQVDVQIEKTEGEHEFACTQLHHTMMGRNIVKEANLSDYKKDSRAGNPKVLFETHKGKLPPAEISIWDEHDKSTGHFWNKVIDLNKCTGCGACVISCHAENNVPVVGKEEVRKHRDMHWLRIDRYYSSDMNEETAKKEGSNPINTYQKMEVASENPEVVFQPVMCQHCNNAPCETVCPVAATTHSSEGLNHMTYNRCIGTRYCANNCPYKVRRFNWFNYKEKEDFKNINPAQDDLSSMVLNPDVTVRARGVMEKCSMCIQRIQGAKLKAKKEGRQIVDGEITMACEEVCGTGAISFGDANNKNSIVAKQLKNDRTYQLLEEIGTRPSVYYKTKIRNKA